MEEKIKERVYGVQKPPLATQQMQPQFFRQPASEQGYIPSQLEREKQAEE